jgi:iron complex transport system substrate-binding protein
MASASAVAEMVARPGWRGLTALQQHQTCAFTPAAYDALVRPGPRLADAADAVADCLARLGTIAK